MPKRENPRFEGDDESAVKFYAERLDRLAGTVRGVMRDYFHRLRKLRIEREVCGPLLETAMLEDFLRSVDSDVPLNLFRDALAKAQPQARKPSTERVARSQRSLIPAYDRVL